MNKPNDDSRLKGIKNAQDRKDYSIAFFNSTNSAIEMLKIDQPTSPEDIKNKLVLWREWFLSQHGEYRALVTDQIGASYDPKDHIAKLEATKSLEELSVTWRSFTQDVRQNSDLVKKCQELKEKYENIQRD